jgi:hypothetical protein
VTVQYRFAEMMLSASGIFVGDSGRSIFLEQHVEQKGKQNYFRWEIPYPYIHQIEAESQPEVAMAAETISTLVDVERKAAAAAAGESASPAPSMLPRPRRPETA